MAYFGQSGHGRDFRVGKQVTLAEHPEKQLALGELVGPALLL
jgi:hypothetical protein